MIIFYRVLSFFINSIALLLTISLVMSIAALIASPLAMLSAFMMVAIILYSFFSNKFQQLVLLRQQPVKASLRDWIRVNGIVSIIFSAMIVLEVPFLLQHPQLFADAMRNFGAEVPKGTISTFFIVLFLYALALLGHVVWTFILMKKHKEFFK